MCFFFFNDTATTEIYTLSLHDALPISPQKYPYLQEKGSEEKGPDESTRPFSFIHPIAEKNSSRKDRKSTRLNSSHANISYAVFCLKKKNSYLVLHFRRANFRTPLRRIS